MDEPIVRISGATEGLGLGPEPRRACRGKVIRFIARRRPPPSIGCACCAASASAGGADLSAAYRGDSDDTEVLTKRGWLRFVEVDPATNEFATRNIENRQELDAMIAHGWGDRDATADVCFPGGARGRQGPRILPRNSALLFLPCRRASSPHAPLKRGEKILWGLCDHTPLLALYFGCFPYLIFLREREERGASWRSFSSQLLSRR